MSQIDNDGSEDVDRLNQQKLKSLREKVNLEIEEDRYYLLDKLYPLISDWRSPLPNLRDIFRPEEIDQLLSDSVQYEGKGPNDYVLAFIEFVSRTGYRDEPRLDEDGEPLLRRTTPIHIAVETDHPSWEKLVHELFKIYDSFDANYADDEGLTHFHAASIAGCHRACKKFLEHGHDPNELDQESTDPPLHLALYNGRLEVAELLLRHGADPNLANPTGSTPLHYICLEGAELDSTRLFFKICDELNLAVRLDARDELGDTPLHLALRNGKMKAVISLLRRGASPILADKNRSTPLHIICHKKYNDLATMLLEINDDNDERTLMVDVRDDQGDTPLHLALRNKNKKATELLLKYGVDPNSANLKGLTALHIVSQENERYDLAKVLFEICKQKNVTLRVDARDEFGDTPLHLALRSNNKRLVELLLRQGADVNLANEEGSTPLHIVPKTPDSYNLAKMLFEVCDDIGRLINVDAQDKLGNTALHYELKYACLGPRDLMELLLRRGADPNLANEDGSTLLHVLCDGLVQGRSLMKELFRICDDVGRWIDVNARDERGYTPLNLDVFWGWESDSFSLLIGRGADPSLANAHGWTPLHHICKRDETSFFDDETVQVFLEICDENDRTLPIDARNKDGDTPLLVALASGHLVEPLLRRGPDLSLANEEGSTPLHVICKREIEADVLAAKLFGICDEIELTVPIDARDKLGRTPLQWAVANLLPKTVDVLLDRGADLADFVFPTADYLAEDFLPEEPYDSRLNLKLKAASGVLVVVERLAERGYQLTQSDALIIATVFAEHGLFDESADLQVPWYDDEEIATRVETIEIRPDLSLRDLVQLRPEEAENVVEYSDYYEFARSHDFSAFPERYREVCGAHLCDTMCRGFLRRWAVYPFWELIQYRLPVEICETIVEQLTNRDLMNICLAAKGQSS
uniref:Uncharacterized protein n=2 Tax=Trichogramma kaykai TaxID=54128 RepID=A0ABD2XRW0_9HYME